MKLSKKVALSLLTTTVLLGNSATLNLQTLVKPNVSLATEVLSNEKTTDDQNYNENDYVKVIVKLKEAEVNPNTLTTPEGVADRESSTKPVREEALNKISSLGISYNKLQ